LHEVLDGTAPVLGYVTVVEAHLLAGLAHRELGDQRYLPANLSRPEIAGELSVSLNTVSTHLRSIYAKLQVRDRSSAVRRARELRLLAAGRMR
jgi:LuxR family transcriptional regulator, maltose regulon positive regulatory protein